MFGKVKNAKPQAPISSDFTKLFVDNGSSRAPVSRLLDIISEVNILNIKYNIIDKIYFTMYLI